MNSSARTLLLLAVFAASPAVKTRLAPNAYQGGRSRDEADRAERNASSLAILLGEARANMSDLMFIKTERYLHSGVAYEPHLDMDAMSQSGEIKAQDKPKTRLAAAAAKPGAMKHADAPDTIVKPEDQDFRGFIGRLERKVKPWKSKSEGDTHTDGTELLPWYRLMTLSDPHNVRAYLIGAWWLRDRGKDAELEEALKFIREGIANNPDSYQLYLTAGYLEKKLGRNLDALASFHRAADEAAAQRPAEGPTPEGRWTDYQEEDALAAMRMAVMMEKEHGDRGKALQSAEAYLARVGKDAVLERQATQLKGGERPESLDLTGPEAERDPRGADATHDHGHGSGAHHHEGHTHDDPSIAPHAGWLAPLGENFLELVLDAKNGAITIYSLAGDEKTARPIPARTMRVSARLENGESISLELNPVPLAGDAPGASSRFAGTHWALAGAGPFEAAVEAAPDEGELRADFSVIPGQKQTAYICPMGCEKDKAYFKAGTICPVCKMDLVPFSEAHGDHEAKHGGQFFMAADLWHHLEGVMAGAREFRLYFYNNFTKPISCKALAGRIDIQLFPVDAKGHAAGEASAGAPTPAPDGRWAAFQVPEAITYPFQIDVRIRFEGREAPDLFSFVFERPSDFTE